MFRLRVLEKILRIAALSAALLSQAYAAQEIPLAAAERSEVLKGKIVVRDIPDLGKPGKTFEALGVIPCGLEEAFAVITDYRHYAEFMPRVEQVVVREEDTTGHVVEIRLALPLGQQRRYRLKYCSRKTSEEFEVLWEKLPWPELPPNQTVKDTSGRWLVRTFDAGGLLASYRVYTDPGPIPLGLDGLAYTLGRRGMRDVIEKVRLRVRTQRLSPAD
jgi:hypothetical protein